MFEVHYYIAVFTLFSGLDKKVDTCTLCEEYAGLAVEYLAENKTQTEIVEALHNSCSQLHSLKQQVWLKRVHRYMHV